MAHVGTNLFDGRYTILPDGRVFRNRLKSSKLLRTKQHRKGYIEIELYPVENGGKKPFKLHRLLAQTFIPNPENKLQVNHKDGNKANNSLANLEWSTNSENQLHAWATGLQPKVKEGKSVVQRSLDGSEIITWNKQSYAAIMNYGSLERKKNISAACRRGGGKSHGFFWERRVA